MQWDMIIGLEVHAQLTTQTKLFSNASTAYGGSANVHTSYVDAALPGTLPVMNREALIKAIQFGLAINAQINPCSWFERKHYFYPDLPKGYQISQFQSPVVQNGQLEISLADGRDKAVHIVRAHLEEDAGKSVHDAHIAYSGIDLNRAGIPLLEIVSAPCLTSADEAIRYLKTLHRLVRFLGICDANMQEGSFRCDVNISLKPAGSQTLGTRTELKNLNSFRFIEKAIAFEYQRQKQCLEQGETMVQETRLYDPDKDCTRPMRSKENEQDYRYFPDPDLLPLYVDETLIHSIQASLPPLPAAIMSELQSCTALTEDDIQFLLTSPEHYAYYKAVCRETALAGAEKTVVNWLKGPYSALLNEAQASFSQPPIDAPSLALLIQALVEQSISSTSARKIFQESWKKGERLADKIAAVRNGQMPDMAEIDSMVQDCLLKNPQQVAQYKAGKTKLLGFFVGQLMQQSQGAADPAVLSACLKKHLD
ncbi:MAG: Asp-tRNA(Asn)/Glu-tRNA(Gln) amidotransferase subunit GatB [Legionellaceae bacterium]|nr:Asp-tRNA(Asn)/Glu-tRNA(Gln) amidotransferase subunit GatB [Legionellaceae bacterium]